MFLFDFLENNHKLQTYSASGYVAWNRNDDDDDDDNAHILKHCITPNAGRLLWRSAGETCTPISHHHHTPCVAMKNRPRPNIRHTSLLINSKLLTQRRN